MGLQFCSDKANTDSVFGLFPSVFLSLSSYVMPKLRFHTVEGAGRSYLSDKLYAENWTCA